MSPFNPFVIESHDCRADGSAPSTLLAVLLIPSFVRPNNSLVRSFMRWKKLGWLRSLVGNSILGKFENKPPSESDSCTGLGKLFRSNNFGIWNLGTFNFGISHFGN